MAQGRALRAGGASGRLTCSMREAPAALLGHGFCKPTCRATSSLPLGFAGEYRALSRPTLLAQPRRTPLYRGAPSAVSTVTATLKASSSAQQDVQVDIAPAVDTVIHTKLGVWRVRPFQNRDWSRVVAIQTSSFHEPVPVAPIDKFFYHQFQAEVVDALRQKFKYSSPEFFQMLVAEEVVDGEDIDDLCDRSSAADSSNSSGTSSSQDGNSHVVGVVEVSLMDGVDVLEHLPAGTKQYCYVSSTAVDQTCRRRGVAQALLQAAEMQAMLWRQPHLTLHVHKDNKPAVALYSACGFSVMHEDPSWKAMLAIRIRVLMHKYLGSFSGPDMQDSA